MWRLAAEEARRTIEYQYETVSDIDTKASSLMRMNLLVVGLLVTGLSVSVGRESMSPQAFVTEYTTTGMILLLVSTVLAGITYTSTKLRIGVDSGTVRQMLSGELTEAQTERGLAKSYARWIAENERASKTNARMLSASIATGMFAIVLLAGGASRRYPTAPAVFSSSACSSLDC